MNKNLAVFLEPWPVMEEAFEPLRNLRNCPQDPIFHAEGDVYVHTQAVCRAMEAMPEWQALPPRARAILRAAAAFHDVGKPAKTEQNGEGRVSSKNHALFGARMVRELLYRHHPIPFADREAICALVLLHGLPHTFLDKPDPVRSVVRASLAVSCEWLAILAAADAKGRICQVPDGWDDVALFRDFCVEQGCLGGPRVFPSERSRYLYFNAGKRECLDYPVYDDSRFEVILMSGLPAAGKDTVVRDRFLDLPEISLDALREELDVDPSDDQAPIAAAAKERARELMRARQGFVWNATNISRPRRKTLISFFAEYGGRTRIVYVESPWTELLNRNRARLHPVPSEVIRKLSEKLDIPGADEACGAEYITEAPSLSA